MVGLLCKGGEVMASMVRIDRNALENFCTEVFENLGLPREEAVDSASILVAADARAIGSHGVGRLWRYVNGIKKQIMLGSAEPLVLTDTAISLVLDAQGAWNGLSKRTMDMIEGRLWGLPSHPSEFEHSGSQVLH